MHFLKHKDTIICGSEVEIQKLACFSCSSFLSNLFMLSSLFFIAANCWMEGPTSKRLFGFFCPMLLLLCAFRCTTASTAPSPPEVEPSRPEAVRDSPDDPARCSPSLLEEVLGDSGPAALPAAGVGDAMTKRLRSAPPQKRHPRRDACARSRDEERRC